VTGRTCGSRNGLRHDVRIHEADRPRGARIRVGGTVLLLLDRR